MTKDFTTTIIPTVISKPNATAKTPRQSTLNFIRQFAGVYITLPGIAVSTTVAN